ncbi:MAG TPA: histidine kinase [Casimicrobiaceae bacterium]|nr:histidine kinase [Casimicrobiaceae bacterium]
MASPLATRHPADDVARPKATAPRSRWYHGLRPHGFAIVAIVALLDALRDSAKYIVMQPFPEWSVYFASATAYAALIGCTVLLVVVYVVHRIPRQSARQYATVFLAVAAAAGVSMLAFGSYGEEWDLDSALFDFLPQWARYSALGMLVAGAWLYVRAEAEHVSTLERIAVDSARLDQQTAEARLQVLEAQIEPHFLFNTLANVKRLYEIDPEHGARMLQNLKAYLAVALPQMRENASTLGREMTHVTAYLNIQKIRMGRRLAFAIDVPESLQDARMPALMLLTLVENAIKHGLNPLREGGAITIRAARQADRVQVAISDTGRGFVQTSGGGTGLANIRARLAALYGDKAKLSLAQNAPHGITATLDVPYETIDPRVRSVIHRDAPG